MKRLSRINAAEEGESKLLDMLDALKDDFEYLVAGLEKLDRSGAESSNNGLIIAEQLQSSLQDFINQIADEVVE